MLTIDVVMNFDKFDSKIDWLSSKVRALAEMGLFQFAEAVMAVSKEQYVPVLTGALRASGHVQPPEWAGNVLRVVMGFGSSSVNYALSVHENLAASHRVGSSKYLEIPLLHMASSMPAFVGDVIKNGLAA